MATFLACSYLMLSACMSSQEALADWSWLEAEMINKVGDNVSSVFFIPGTVHDRAFHSVDESFRRFEICILRMGAGVN
jgi:hypothetical protein